MKQLRTLLAIVLSVCCVTAAPALAVDAGQEVPLTVVVATDTELPAADTASPTEDTTGDKGGSSSSSSSSSSKSKSSKKEQTRNGVRIAGKQKEKVKKGDSKKKVWISKTSGTKYHKKSCRTITKSKKQKVKLSVAKENGFSRCKVCGGY